MKKAVAVLVAAIVVGLVVGWLVWRLLDVNRRPHVLLISIDTLRADHLGSYGYHRDTSPFLDHLARRGVRFENAFVNTHGTTPSHTTILTSTFQETHGVAYREGAISGVPGGLPMLQEILRDSGYLTLGVTGGGNVSRSFGFARGFDVYEGRERSVAASAMPNRPVPCCGWRSGGDAPVGQG